MPKRSVYFKEEEDVLYEPFKQLTEESGDTIGGVFAKAMQDYIAKKKNEESGMKEYTMFVGEVDSTDGEIGEHVKFTGYELGRGNLKTGAHEEVEQVLYRTRKNKFLLYESVEYPGHQSTSYRVINGLDELKKVQLANGISFNLSKEGTAVRVLDI